MATTHIRAMTTFVEVEERRGFKGWMMAIYLEEDNKLVITCHAEIGL